MMIRLFITGRTSYLGHYKQVMMFTRIKLKKKSLSKRVIHAELQVPELQIKILRVLFDVRTFFCHLII